jgi:hypothetical protein
MNTATGQTRQDARMSVLTADGLSVAETNTLVAALEVLAAHPDVAAELIAVLSGDNSALMARLNA